MAHPNIIHSHIVDTKWELIPYPCFAIIFDSVSRVFARTSCGLQPEWKWLTTCVQNESFISFETETRSVVKQWETKTRDELTNRREKDTASPFFTDQLNHTLTSLVSFSYLKQSQSTRKGGYCCFSFLALKSHQEVQMYTEWAITLAWWGFIAENFGNAGRTTTQWTFE